MVSGALGGFRQAPTPTVETLDNAIKRADKPSIIHNFQFVVDGILREAIEGLCYQVCETVVQRPDWSKLQEDYDGYCRKIAEKKEGGERVPISYGSIPRFSLVSFHEYASGIKGIEEDVGTKDEDSPDYLTYRRLRQGVNRGVVDVIWESPFRDIAIGPAELGGMNGLLSRAGQLNRYGDELARIACVVDLLSGFSVAARKAQEGIIHDLAMLSPHGGVGMPYGDAERMQSDILTEMRELSNIGSWTTRVLGTHIVGAGIDIIGRYKARLEEIVGAAGDMVVVSYNFGNVPGMGDIAGSAEVRINDAKERIRDVIDLAGRAVACLQDPGQERQQGFVRNSTSSTPSPNSPRRF